MAGLVGGVGEGDEPGRSLEDGFGGFFDVGEAEAAFGGGHGVGDEGDEGGVGVRLGGFEEGAEGLEGFGEAEAGLVGEVGDVDAVEVEVEGGEGGEGGGFHAV